MEWLRAVEQEVQVPVTEREYVPTGVPELAGCGAAAPPPPPQAANASMSSTSAPKAAAVAHLGCTLIVLMRSACAKLPDAKNTIVHRNHGCG